MFPRFPSLKDFSSPSPQFECVTPLRLLLIKNSQPKVWSDV